MEQFNPFSLVGKQILVTGASSGIGKGIALACAKMGATVIITGRNVERLNETLSLMSEGDHKAISADLTKAEDIDRLVSELPKLDGLCNVQVWVVVFLASRLARMILPT